MLSALLQIPGIQGESRDSKYPGSAGWMELDGWGFGQTQSGTSAYGSGSAAGRVSMEDFTFNKHFDKSSVKVVRAVRPRPVHRQRNTAGAPHRREERRIGRLF